jgi:hypothetical protein
MVARHRSGHSVPKPMNLNLPSPMPSLSFVLLEAATGSYLSMVVQCPRHWAKSWVLRDDGAAIVLNKLAALGTSAIRFQTLVDITHLFLAFPHCECFQPGFP